MDSIITLVMICAALSLLLNVVLKKFHVESVIGYIITGMTVGFAFNLEQNASLAVIAEFGIVFLMFTIGLEFSPDKLRLMRREVFLYGALQMLVTAAIFFAIGWLIGLAIQVNLIVSLALSLSSTAIVLNLLTKSGKISRRYGRNAVGILLFQDIAVIPLLLMVSILSSEQQSIAKLLLDVAMDGGIVFLLLFLGGRILTPHVMEHVIGTRSNELFVGAILLFVIGAAELAHGLGFSYSLGAFLAGMVLSETQYKHQVEADLTPFRDLLLGVFFITVGMQVNPLFVLTHLPVILAVMVGLLLVKSLVLFACLWFFNGTHTSLKSALLLAQCGEFSFVIFETAQANNLFIDPQRGQVLVMAVVLTMMLTPFVFQHLDTLVAKLASEPEPKPGGHGIDEIEQDVDERHVVICGYGDLGQRIGAKLDQAGVPFVGVEHDGTRFRDAKGRGLPVHFGNSANRQFLEKIHIDRARAVVIAMSNEPRILLVTQSLRTIAPDVPIMVCSPTAQLTAELSALGVLQPIDGLDQTAEGLAQRVIERELALAEEAP